MKQYDLCLLDPPWPYNRNYGGDPKNGGITYQTMSIEDISKILIKDIMKEDSLCLMWGTCPKLKEGIYCLESLGFKYITVIFTWLKRNKNGTIYSGLGHYSKGNQELVLLGKRGKGLKRIRKDIKQPIESVRGRHSAKPKETFTRIESLFGSDLNYIELFARDRQPNWDCLGLELSGLDINVEIEQIKQGTWRQS